MLHGCQIGNRVLVGMGAIILDGAIVEDDVLIAAGTLVPPGKHLLSGYSIWGTPFASIELSARRKKARCLRSAGNYVRLKDEFIDELP